jgi:DNA-directed RNA polymerase subunit RPC12/RpoP
MVNDMVKCPYCGFEGEFKLLKTWKFRFYDVRRLRCPRCSGVFNHYYGISPRTGKVSEFVIKR